jgi:hypothetical protein
MDAYGWRPRVPPSSTAQRCVTPYGRRGRRDEGRTSRRPRTGSDPQAHRPRPQGRRTTSKRTRNENGASRLGGTLFAISENRNQQGGTHQDIGGRNQGRRRINVRSRVGRNQAIRAVIGLSTNFAGVFAIRRDVIAMAMLDRDHPDRRQQQQGEAGEESGTGGYHSNQSSCGQTEVKRGKAFRARHGAVRHRWS